MNEAQRSNREGPQVRQIRHDVRGNLSVIKMGLEIIETLHNAAEETQQIIDMMKQNLTALESNIERLIEISHSQSEAKQTDGAS